MSEKRVHRKKQKVIEKLDFNPYKILELTKESNLDDIKKAYRKKALQWDPDKNPDRRELAQKKFSQIARALEFLLNTLARTELDRDRYLNARKAKYERKRAKTLDAKRRKSKEALVAAEAVDETGVSTSIVIGKSTIDAKTTLRMQRKEFVKITKQRINTQRLAAKLLKLHQRLAAKRLKLHQRQAARRLKLDQRQVAKPLKLDQRRAAKLSKLDEKLIPKLILTFPGQAVSCNMLSRKHGQLRAILPEVKTTMMTMSLKKGTKNFVGKYRLVGRNTDVFYKAPIADCSKDYLKSIGVSAADYDAAFNANMDNPPASQLAANWQKYYASLLDAMPDIDDDD